MATTETEKLIANYKRDHTMTPTQAQIEAAAKAIFENMSGIDHDEADWIHFRDDCMDGAKAALTAAAEAGEPKYKTWEKADRQDRNVTIERCAQVVDALAKRANRQEITKLEEAAAAIRALKDRV